jgi:VanZ family protein
MRSWAPVAAWMAFLFAVSSQAVVSEVPGLPDWVTHGGAYAILAILVCRALAGGLAAPVSAGQAALAVAIAFSYGVTDEFHQSFVPGRHADAWDLVKNLGGALAGATACAWPRGASEQRRKAA